MLHILFAIKLDQELGQELIKYIKTEKMLALETFPVACLLSAARIHRFSDTVCKFVTLKKGALLIISTDL